MTEESLRTANCLLGEIKKIEETIGKIRPYSEEIVTLEIVAKKSLRGYSDEISKKKFILDSTDPLLLAICSTLEDIKSELKNKFDQLDSNSEENVLEPIRKTSFWKKVWN